MTKIEELLADLHGATIATLLERVKSGEATATELNVARQMLKDNNIVSLATPDSPLADLDEVMGEFDPELETNVVPMYK